MRHREAAAFPLRVAVAPCFWDHGDLKKGSRTMFMKREVYFSSPLSNIPHVNKKEELRTHFLMSSQELKSFLHHKSSRHALKESACENSWSVGRKGIVWCFVKRKMGVAVSDLAVTLFSAFSAFCATHKDPRRMRILWLHNGYCYIRNLGLPYRKHRETTFLFLALCSLIQYFLSHMQSQFALTHITNHLYFENISTFTLLVRST